MLYYLHLLEPMIPSARVFRYITVRAFGGAATAFAVTMILGPMMIRALRRLRVSQKERCEEAPPLYVLHAKKEGTPTMGGLLILLALVVSCLLWGIPTSLMLRLAVLGTLFMGLIGFWDDYRKIVKRDTRGLPGRCKILLQLLWAVTLAVVLLNTQETAVQARQLMVPFLKDPVIRDLGVLGVMVFMALILVGSSNAVNLTDGLDGLAIGCSGSAALAYLVMAYAAGHITFAEYLRIPYVNGSGELAVFCGCLLGASLGFMWFNCHPAQVFMGDTGSLALGGGIAMTAILIKQELVLIIVGGVFVMEAVSVMLQVLSFQTRGRRLFAMAPIHHHFEIKKWSETQVVVRFWILSILCAIAGVLTLKIR